MSQQNQSQPSNDITATAESLTRGTLRVSFGRPDPAIHDAAMASKADASNVRTKVWTQDDRVSVNVGSEIGQPNGRGEFTSARLNGRSVFAGAMTEDSLISVGGMEMRVREAMSTGMVERTANGFKLIGGTSLGK